MNDAQSRRVMRGLAGHEDEAIESLDTSWGEGWDEAVTRIRRIMPLTDDDHLIPDPTFLARLRTRHALREPLTSEAPAQLAATLANHEEHVAEGFTTLGHRALGQELPRTQAQVTYSLERYRALTAAQFGELRNAVTRNALGGLHVDDLDRELVRLRARGRSRADLHHHESILGLSRTATGERAELLGYERFQYFGPSDGRLRPFCAHHIHETYTREEIDALDNGQGTDVFTHGGGFRCRHHWRPVRDDWAVESPGQVFETDDAGGGSTPPGEPPRGGGSGGGDDERLIPLAELRTLWDIPSRHDWHEAVGELTVDEVWAATSEAVAWVRAQAARFGVDLSRRGPEARRQQFLAELVLGAAEVTDDLPRPTKRLVIADELRLRRPRRASEIQARYARDRLLIGRGSIGPNRWGSAWRADGVHVAARGYSWIPERLEGSSTLFFRRAIGRSSYLPQTNSIQLVNRADTNPAMRDRPFSLRQSHETGHHLELVNTRIAEAAVLWREEALRQRRDYLRGFGEAEVATLPINDARFVVPGHGDDPVRAILHRTSGGAWSAASPFVDLYVGRLYGQPVPNTEWAQTEVFSVGLEHLDNPTILLRLWNNHPEHVGFLLAVMQGRFGWRGVR